MPFSLFKTMTPQIQRNLFFKVKLTTKIYFSSWASNQIQTSFLPIQDSIKFCAIFAFAQNNSKKFVLYFKDINQNLLSKWIIFSFKSGFESGLVPFSVLKIVTPQIHRNLFFKVKIATGEYFV